MNSAIERLLTLRVSDVMNSPVVTVEVSSTMADAAKRITSNDVSGVPVVDAKGRCVGVLSVADYADRAQRVAELETVSAHETVMIKAPGKDATPIDSVADELVSDHMSPLVLTISPSATIMNAARVMCREHIHRLIIVDEDQRPVGVISSLDLVAAMVAAVEE